MSGLQALMNWPREEYQTPPTPSHSGFMARTQDSSSLQQGEDSEHSTQAPESPETSSNTSLGSKRAANVDQYIERVSQRTKLNPESRKTLVHFSKMSYEEQKVFKMGKLLQIQQVIDAIQPASAKFVITKDQKTFIQKLSINILLCHSLSSYCESVTGIGLGILVCHLTLSGYTDAVRINPTKKKAFETAMESELTACRNIIKAAMLKSMGTLVVAEDGTESCQEALNIVNFVTGLSDKLHKSHMYPLLNDVQITLKMCVRISFLRQVLLDDPSIAYWTTVDKKLADVCTQYPEAQECSNFMMGVLHEDYNTFGVALADDLSDVRPSESQTEANLFAQNRENELPEPFDVGDDA
ncbi:hypothetical protein C8Q75DRAFT_803836 [Abortiporus biennis]|nr:hypothetical protein C8Q75DRAFT_803836 [Abortiporus biennis]